MNVSELQQIAQKQVKLKPTTLPVSSFSIADCLGLPVKNSVQCKKDCGNSPYPLLKCNAIYALYNGEFTVYYDESYPYKNFAVAHEVAHHLLGHTSDGVYQHSDANLLAAILIAPKELILSNGIRNAAELSDICNIPISTAVDYWNALGIEEEVSNEDYLRQIKSMVGDVVKMLGLMQPLRGGGCCE